MGDLFKPSSTGIRNPTDNKRENGRVINTPRFAEFGGLTGPSKAVTGNNIKIRKPGAAEK
jgi:hypothetical protein